MRPVLLLVSASLLSWACFSGSWLAAQTATPPPQSARQALIEMLFGKGEADFVKHLPVDARRTLIRKGESPETSVALHISTIGRELSNSQHLETFDSGPTLLTTEPNKNEKIEVLVEHDSLLGEDDEIELSVRYYKNGQLQSLPIVPRFTLTFRQEKEVWRLTEASAAARVPLTDPDYLKGLRKQQDESYESAAQMRMVAIAAAENRFVSQYPGVGYTCTLTNLFAKNGGAQGGYDPGQGGADWNGYHFSLAGCDGSPALRFRLSAVPADSDEEMKTFCADESGNLRFITGERSSDCFSSGQPVSKVDNPRFVD
jgi:hypothetical protein